MSPARLLMDAVERQRGGFLLWAPICLGLGIGAYFSLKSEPDAAIWLAILPVAAILLAIAFRSRTVLGVLAIGALLAVTGFGIAALRANAVAEVKLGWRYYGPIEGRIVAIDRSHSDALRLTLDRVRLSRLSPERTPARVRVSLHGRQGFIDPEPGLTVILTGHLSPPSGPVEPGGYDFRRQAWFQGLGAVGYTRTPVLALAPAVEGAPGVRLYRLRMAISRRINEALPGRSGAFAAAILVGDRSGIDEATAEDLRKANLAHLLAISGLHMGLLTGVVFTAIRLGCALIPALALRYPVRKWAAGAAIAMGAIYLALSGASVATERAFIMIAVMFGAVLLDRQAITLRSVALAALVVLLLRPEALLGPGFQMSFAATTALVVAYGATSRLTRSQRRWPLWAQALFGVSFSSLIAGTATAPIAAAHFNQIPHYGLIANVLTVPLMGAVIMPAALVAALLAPFGLEGVALEAMNWPILWILRVAETVAGWPASVSRIVAPGPAVLPLICLGALVFVLWRGRARWGGAAAMMAAFAMWGTAERPDILVADTGGLIGVMTPDGRALSKEVGDGFSADTWLENDGDTAGRETAARRSAFKVEGRVREAELGPMSILHATGKQAAAVVLDRCANGQIVVLNIAMPEGDGPKSLCDIYDIRRLRTEGSLSFTLRDEGVKRATASEQAGDRLWTR